LNEDYRHLSISDNSMDGVYAVESECYAQGSAKIDLIREVHRILKPKAKFVVADCMIKVNASELPPFIRKSYNSLCNHWAFDEMSNIYDFKKGLEDTGFVDVKVEDYSMKVALSVMWVPLKIFQFILSKKRKKLEIKDSSWSNLIASFNAIILGLSRKNFSYYVISARKK
jgi:SAM-dependent methyltransferase